MLLLLHSRMEQQPATHDPYMVRNAAEIEHDTKRTRILLHVYFIRRYNFNEALITYFDLVFEAISRFTDNSFSPYWYWKSYYKYCSVFEDGSGLKFPLILSTLRIRTTRLPVKFISIKKWKIKWPTNTLETNKKPQDHKMS